MAETDPQEPALSRRDAYILEHLIQHGPCARVPGQLVDLGFAQPTSRGYGATSIGGAWLEAHFDWLHAPDDRETVIEHAPSLAVQPEQENAELLRLLTDLVAEAADLDAWPSGSHTRALKAAQDHLAAVTS